MIGLSAGPVNPGDEARSTSVGGSTLLPRSWVKYHSISVSVTTYLPGGKYTIACRAGAYGRPPSVGGCFGTDFWSRPQLIAF
eukprot:SAG25_NODE_545_length_7036_cov_4.224593_5_plen_82_part_00